MTNLRSEKMPIIVPLHGKRRSKEYERCYVMKLEKVF